MLDVLQQLDLPQRRQRKLEIRENHTHPLVLLLLVDHDLFERVEHVRLVCEVDLVDPANH